MTTYRLQILLVCIFTLLRCSNDDLDGESDRNQVQFANLSIIADETTDILQLDVQNDAENISTFNISDALGLEGFDLLDLQGNQLTFFTFTIDDFIVSQYNIETSNVFVQNGLCPVEPTEFRRGVLTDDNLIGYISTQDNVTYPMNFLTIFNKTTSQCSKTVIGQGNVVGARIVDDNRLYITLINDQGGYILRKINLLQLNVEQDLVFDELFKATLEDNRLHVFFFDDVYEIYDKNSFELLSSSTFNTQLLGLNPGLFNSIIQDDIIYTKIEYQQPSPLPSGPATIDLTTSQYLQGTDELGIRIRQKLNNLYGINTELTEFVFDLENEMIIYGFDVSAPNGEGGILYTNFDADFLNIVNTEITPDLLIIRD